MRRAEKPARVNPLDCQLCRYVEVCAWGSAWPELYRLGLMIRPEDCAHYNLALRPTRAAEVRHG